MSGYAEKLAGGALMEGGYGFLQKPFGAAELLEALQHALARHGDQDVPPHR